MGQIVVERTLAAGHDVVAFDIDEDAVVTAASRTDWARGSGSG
jgi:6-phosphogluconate dehydrogenase